MAASHQKLSSKHLPQTPNWKVRITTRNPSSSAAQALAAQGTEVVQADLSNSSTLYKAFQDANAIFLNTDFWGIYLSFVTAMITSKADSTGEQLADPSKVAYETELTHGKNAADVAAQVPTLERFVYSALPATTKVTCGKCHSDHAESKDAIVEYIENELVDLAKKTSLIYLGAYNSNALLSPKLDPLHGKYKQIPRCQIIDPNESTGPFVRALIEDEAPGIKLLGYNTKSYLSYQEICDIWSRASGKKAGFARGSPALAEFGYTGSIKVIEPSDLKNTVQTKSWEVWIMGRGSKLILEVV
ncbi:hypothetical protein BGW36DRAFT_359426 [Talaromyces proteolyticus]|uniref:NmrA-like domain-containing protein n=1 Tax=Talaromyces proteolyticus TaxID=1131652 RepID=A0AAD4KPU6_9EURO|nr:uncharacterized protein BGW36DRAFT_359426 [Talaromyces proteolyticus]KAH8697643.1 hypothetical protein BGW36DRAFT_359426 [Talaromyces proteolyticus]